MMMNIQKDCDHILVSEEEIAQIVSDLGKRITADYKDSKRPLLLVCILKGSVVFMADLMRAIDLPMQIDFMKVSSYGNGTVSGGHLNIILDLKREDLSKTDVLVVEDIVDSGRTLSYLKPYLLSKGAADVKCVTLLDKPSRRTADFTPDYTGKVIPDEFVVGYGLDYAEQYRNLPFVGVLKREIYST